MNNYYMPSGGYGGQFQAPQIPSYIQPMPQQPQQHQSMISGKPVDTIEMAKVAEVPVGSYSVFPKADLSEIYIKSWNPNGTTKITVFTPSDSQNSEKQIDLNDIMKKISDLEIKFDSTFAMVDSKKSEGVKKVNEY